MNCGSVGLSASSARTVCSQGLNRRLAYPQHQPRGLRQGQLHQQQPRLNQFALQRNVPGLCPARGARQAKSCVVTRAGAAVGILPLGFDLLTFLGSTVVVVPLFKKLNISPVLGFLFSGVLLHQFGLIRDPKDMEALSELGVLFLLFEMGLELSLDRLKALAKYAFGLGTLQMVLCTAIFSAFALPAGQGIGTKLLEMLAHAPSSLVSIRSVDEAVVIGGALSMSSSAFVLQLLSERGEMPTRFGAATLGILLLQDIAVVPFLVLLPLVVHMQAAGGIPDGLATSPGGLLAMLGPTAIKTCLGLGMLLVGGRVLLRRVFEVVAQSDNSETFVGLCLLTVAGAALLTEKLGFSDTMGAFTAGVLLSESSFKTQVEADIRPFRGLLLGLFFVTTGGSIDMGVLKNNWEVISWILIGLITVKTSVVAAVGPKFGLTRGEAIRTGLLLSQGGEFAFVLLSLANSLKVLPENLNQVLIIVVVLSMALTPGLAELGKVAGDWVEEQCKGARAELPEAAGQEARWEDGHEIAEPVVICGFGPHGQMLAAMLESPLASLPDQRARSYIAFDLDPARVQSARAAGYNVVYGDGSRASVLKAAGVSKPRAVAVCLTNNKVAAHRAVASLRTSFPTVPLYALGGDMRDAAELEEAGADCCVIEATAAGLSMATEILSRMGASMSELSQAEKTIEKAMAERTSALAQRIARYGAGALEDFQDGMLLPGKGSITEATATSPTLVPVAASGSSSSSDSVVISQLAPPDTLPSMADAMPASMSSRSYTSVSNSDGEEAGAVILDNRNVPAVKVSSKGLAKAVATASLDCSGEDSSVAVEEMATMVMVDTGKQQLQKQQQDKVAGAGQPEQILSRSEVTHAATAGGNGKSIAGSTTRGEAGQEARTVVSASSVDS